MTHTILIVEDDLTTRDYLRDILTDKGYSVYSAASGTKAISLLEKTQPDLILLDLVLPDIEGESILKKIKENYPDVAVIILSGKDEVDDVVRGFDIGADDYVTKPFQEEVLLARISTRLKEGSPKNSKLKLDDLELDTKRLSVKRGDRVIELTPQEFKLLEYLMTNKNQVLTREMILSRIWSTSPDIETRVVDVYIGYLRKKIDKGHTKKLITSVRGFGYTVKA